MSRSYKKHPFGGIGGDRHGVEKQYKQHAHRQLRRAVRVELSRGGEDFPHDKEFGDPWGGPKDGKCRYTGPDAYRK